MAGQLLLTFRWYISWHLIPLCNQVLISHNISTFICRAYNHSVQPFAEFQWEKITNISQRDTPPKMKILSSFTHPQVVANLYEFILLLNTNEDILMAPLTSIVEKKYYGNQWCPTTVWFFQSFFKISCFVFQQKKETHTGLQGRVSL